MKRKTIAFALYPDRGAYYATFKLAKALQSQGHRIIYFGPEEFKNEISRQDLEFQVLFPNEKRKGTYDPDASLQKTGVIKKLKNNIEDFASQLQMLYQLICTDRFRQILMKNKIDLVIVDSMLSHISLAAACTTVKVINITMELFAISHRVPPNYTGIIPGKGALSFLTIQAAWFKIGVVYYFQQAMFFILLKIFSIKTLDKKLHQQYLQMKRNSGLKFILSEYVCRPVLPQLVLCAKDFDFNYLPDHEKQIYLGHNIDFTRKEVDFDWKRLNNSAPVILCSLGTHVADYPFAERFFNSIKKLAYQMPDMNFVVSLGPGRSESSYDNLPPNFIGQIRVPQLAILEKACLMVTNGGLGTVKECVMHGVPMIVLPCAFDQPGNAARVVYHKIGLKANIQRINSRKLFKMIGNIRGNHSFYENINRLRIKIDSEQEFMQGLEYIEQVLS